MEHSQGRPPCLSGTLVQEFLVLLFLIIWSLERGIFPATQPNSNALVKSCASLQHIKISTRAKCQGERLDPDRNISSLGSWRFSKTGGKEGVCFASAPAGMVQKGCRPLDDRLKQHAARMC